MLAARREPTITMKTAHDVRQLRKCAKCGGAGDQRHMPSVNGQLMHGYCALDEIGVDGVASLPMAELGKITLGEIGGKAMKAICGKVR